MTVWYRRILVLMAAAIGLLGGARAQGEVPSVDEITRKVSQAALRYIEAVSCEHGGVAAKDIAALGAYGFDEGRSYPTATYAVVWSGDIGCMGGSGTVSSNILVVRVGPTPEFLVDPNASSPVVHFEIPVKYVDKLVGNTADQLVLEGFDYGPNDASCCPSIHKRVTMQVDEKGNWKTLKQRTLGVRQQQQ